MSEVKVAERTVDQIDADIAKLTKEKDDRLKASKDADLDTVKKLCKQHGFTATQLRSVLAKKGKRKPAAGGAAKKTPAKKAAARKTPKLKQ